MERLPLDDLPEHSAWTAYLLDPARDPPGEPTAYTGTEHYEKIYSHALEEYRENPLPVTEAVERIRSRGRPEPSPVSMNQRLYLVDPDELLRREYETVRTALEPALAGGETVFDLGCGWGWTLDAIATGFPGVRVVGGEYVPAGVELAREIVADGDEQVTVEQFDFLDDWSLVEAADEESVVFTKGALATLPRTETIVERLAALTAEGPITAGVHLEQVGPHPETVLGLLRRRYASERGYGDEILEQLREAPPLEVIDVTYDVYGSNPLHPLTRIRWQAA